MSQSAKILALKELKDSGEFDNMTWLILEYAKIEKTFFIYQVIEDLGLKRSSATGRVSDLEDQGFVKNIAALGTKYSNAKQGYYKYLESEEEQKKHREERNEERFQRWLKNGEKYGHFDRLYEG